MESNHKTPFEDRLACFELIQKRAVLVMQFLASGEDEGKCLGNLLKLISKQRSYLVQSKEHLLNVWEAIRVDEVLLDYLLVLTSDLQVCLANTPFSFASLTNELAAAQGDLAGADSVIDPDLKERLPTYERLLPLYEANPWYVTLLLLRQAGLANAALDGSST